MIKKIERVLKWMCGWMEGGRRVLDRREISKVQLHNPDRG